MSKFRITSQVIEEVSHYTGPNALNINSYKHFQSLINKSKWSIDDLQFLKQCINDGMEEFLYKLFWIKSQHPLILKYFPEIEHHKARSIDELYALRDAIKEGHIQPEEYSEYGLRSTSFDEFSRTNQERKANNIEVKSQANNHIAIQKIAAKKDNSSLAK